ncbi:MAG: M48 family metallopeptidase [Candidatus Kapaibacterium sp.]
MKKRLWRDFLILLVLFLGVWIFFVYFPIVDSEEVKVTYKYKENEIKQKLIELMDFKQSDSDTTQLLRSLGELKHLVSDNDIKYELYYSDSREINAYALPGNIIVLNRGIILECDTPEELIGVIAHELGHLKMKHHSDQLITTLSIELLLAGSGSTASEITKILTQSAFSREMETEADDYAIKKMKELGISPNYLAKLFKKMYKKSDMIPEFLNSHPGMNERISKFSKFQFEESKLTYTFDWLRVKNSL